MGRQLGVKHIVGIINKVTAPQQIEAVKSQLKDLHILAEIDYIPDVQQADLNRKSVYRSSPKLVENLRQAKKALNHLLQADRGSVIT
jgi:CO dehydrogenase nickel-insertion accessory protein CooC1